MKPRHIYPHLLELQASRKITLLLGPRQVGKTTLLRQLHQELGGLYLDLDLSSHYERVATYENLLNTLRLQGYNPDNPQKFYLFLDEFHRYPSMALVMKNVYDHCPAVKIYATGSSALGIKSQVQESLAGRKQILTLYPLSFREYLCFHGRDDLLPLLDRLPGLQTDDYFSLLADIVPYFQDFLVFGGYPEVALAKPAERPQVLESIFDLYIRKDLADFIEPEKLLPARSLIQQLAINHGQQANYSLYGSLAGLDSKKVKHYIEILRETFLLCLLRPYFRNKNKEIAKAPKIYFLDNGVRNYFYRNFNPPALREDAGQLFEAYFIGELLKAGEPPDNLKYYRTKAGHEVDLILDRVSRLWPLELKYKRRLKRSDTRGLAGFLEEYDVPTGYLISLGLLDPSGPIAKWDCFNWGYLEE